MKYVPPQNGPYESGLTARLMYDAVDNLVRKHATAQDFEKTRTSGLGLKELWGRQPILGELEGLVNSYLFDNIGGDIGNFGRIEGKTAEERYKNLHKYVEELKIKYHASHESKRKFQADFAEFNRRGQRLQKELRKIKDLKGDQLIKKIAYDSFSNISMVYTETQIYAQDLNTS